jgi:hypothetical protein
VGVITAGASLGIGVRLGVTDAVGTAAVGVALAVGTGVGVPATVAVAAAAVCVWLNVGVSGNAVSTAGRAVDIDEVGSAGIPPPVS